MKKKEVVNFFRELIDIVAIGYFFNAALLSNILPEYVFDRLSAEMGLNFSSSKTNCRPFDKNSTEDLILREVQKRAAMFNIGSQLCMNLPSVFVALYLGPLSDRIGRKPVLVWCSFTLFIGCVFLIVVDILALPIDYIYITLGCLGSGGSFYGLLMVSAAYISDLYKDDKSRTIRFGILEGLFLLGTSISMYSGGVFVKRFGFRNSFYLCIAIGLLSFLYSVFMKESFTKESTSSLSAVNFLCLPIHLLKTFISGRNNVWKIWLLVICSNMLMFVAPAVLVSLLILTMLNKPFCFEADQIGYFFGTFLLTTGVGTIIATKILPKLMRKSVALVLAVLSGLSMTIAYGFARTTTILYLGIPIGLLSLGQAPLCKAMSCNYVSRKELGSVMALFSAFQAFFTTVGFFIFQPLYVHYNENGHSSHVYFAIAALACVPFVFILGNMLHDLLYEENETIVYRDQDIDKSMDE